ncbi:MAG: hypothetical protein ACK4L4_12595 [Gemmobacter sp.]
MTHTPTQDAGQPGGIISRLLVVLALVLFGLPQTHADGMAANAGPAAQSTVEQVVGIPPAQRNLPRAPLTDDISPDAVLPDAAVQAAPSGPATMVPAPRQSLLPVANRILPPVRGPPAV